MTSKRLLTTISGVVITFVAALILIPGSWAVTSGKEHRFRGRADGANPQSGLVSDGAGNFYGTTSGGGLSTCGQYVPSCGTAFKMSLGQDGSWTESVIYEFKGGSDDGAEPSSSLIFDDSGNLYGTTTGGGNISCGIGCGTVFKLSPNQGGTWTESIIYSFQGGANGFSPYTVIFDGAGNLYGVAEVCSPCSGAVFRLTPSQGGSWTESLLYTFAGGQDGSEPNGPLGFDIAGNLYGTTVGGGTSACECGTVYELSPSQGGTWNKTILYSFKDSLDGANPDSAVTFDGQGNLYGETIEGGSLACPESGCGVVYELTPQTGGSWAFAVAHAFNGLNGSRGNQPDGGLVLDSAGNMYGTTLGGGDAACYGGYGCGTIFELSPKVGGEFTFSMIGEFNNADGASPMAGVIADTAGNLYGTTVQGGDLNCSAPYGCGVVFTVTP
jgi:uncharacterized repeat protein (TIGR03803 family)